MSLHLPSRGALRAAATTSLRPSSTATLCGSMQSLSIAVSAPRRTAGAATTVSPQLATQQRRNIFGWGRKSSEEHEFAKVIKEKQSQGPSAQDVQKKLMTGKLGKSSIFSDEGPRGGEETWEDAREDAARLRNGGLRTQAVMARATDPDPRSRVRWQRKMVARMVRRRLDARDYETREERIARTERQYVSRGPLLNTSTKKLVHLAHQVAGKTVDEAMVQMRFSKKKFARDIVYQLDVAKDEAAVVAGMGLGSARAKADEDNEASSSPPSRALTIKTKDGKWLEIDDPTRLYIEQAWVNKGPFTTPRRRFGGRGRSSVMWGRTSTVTLVIKEEKTRIRLDEERKVKEAKRKPWVHLPNRPVTAQRQYYSW